MSINQISKVVQKVVKDEFSLLTEIPIITVKSDDNRSYHINSDKIKEQLGFIPKKSVEDAVRELCRSFKKGLFKNSFENELYFNVKRLKRIKAS